LERLTAKNNHPIHPLGIAASVCDRTFRKLVILTRVNNDTRRAEIFVRVCSIRRLAHAHIGPQLLRENFSRGSERRLVCDEKQRAAATYPITDNLTLGGSKCRTIGACVIHVLAAKGIHDHENLMGGERCFGELLAIDGNVVTIVEKQISEGLVTIVCCIKVVMSFIEEHAREVFCEGGLINSGIEMRIGNLLGE